MNAYETSRTELTIILRLFTSTTPPTHHSPVQRTVVLVVAAVVVVGGATISAGLRGDRGSRLRTARARTRARAMRVRERGHCQLGTVHVYIHVYKTSTEAALIFLKKSDCLGYAVLVCLVVCLTLLASFFLPSHLS